MASPLPLGVNPIPSHEGVEVLPLLGGLGELTACHELTEQGGHTLRRQLRARGAVLRHIGGRVEHIRLNPRENVGLDALILNLLGGGLALGGVLFVEQFDFVLDERHEVSVLRNGRNGEQSIEVVTLGRFTIGHGINPFSVFWTSAVLL